MAQAPRLWDAGSQGTQRPRERSTGHARWSWSKAHGRGMDCPWRRTTGAEPDAVKAARLVLNGLRHEVARGAVMLEISKT